MSNETLLTVLWLTLLAAACLPSLRLQRAVIELLQRALQLGMALLVTIAALGLIPEDQAPVIAVPIIGVPSASATLHLAERLGASRPESTARLLTATLAVLLGLPLSALLGHLRLTTDDALQRQRLLRQLRHAVDELREATHRIDALPPAERRLPVSRNGLDADPEPDEDDLPVVVTAS